jgi:alkylhydroperoxidase family enzyme
MPTLEGAGHRGRVNLEHPDQLAGIVAELTALRREAGKADPAPYAAVGATWWLVEFPWDGVSVDRVRGVIRDGPAASP